MVMLCTSYCSNAHPIRDGYRIGSLTSFSYLQATLVDLISELFIGI